MSRVALLGLALLAGCGRGAETGAPAVEPPVPIDSPAGASSGEPNLAVAGDGTVYMSWIETAPDSAHELRFAALRDGGWSAPRTIARGRDWFVNWADFPALVVLPDGRVAAHYLQRNAGAEKGYHYDVRVVQSSDGGTTWADPVTPHRDAVPAEHGFVSLYPAAGDSLGLVWLDGRKSHPRFGGTAEMTLRATTLAADGSLGEEVAIDERICDCCQTSLALASAGPVVVYRDRTEDEVRDIYVTRLVDGGWTPGRPVHADGWEIAACPVNGPAVSADGDRIAVAWFTAARDTARVMLAFSDDGGATFGAPVRVDDGAPAGRVDVEMVPEGALVSWIERTEGEAAEVRVRRVDREGRTGAPTTIASSTGARASGFPRMARSGDRVVFAWTEPGGETTRVRTAYSRLGS